VSLCAVAAAVYFLILPRLSARLFRTEVKVSEISMVSPAQAQVTLTATGYVIPQTIALVSAKVAGRVAAVHIKQGDAVEAGAVLVELDRSSEEAAIRAGRARAAAARAAALTARAQVVEAENQAHLARDLAAQGIGAKANAVDTEAKLASARATVHAADAQARALDQEVAALEVDLANYTLRASISGRVLNKPPELGDMIGPSFSGVVNSQVGGIEVADFGSLMVEADVSEARLHLVTVGGPCEVMLDAFPSQRHRCRVKKIVPRVNRAKATVTVDVTFVDPIPDVLPDMAARVSFLAAELDAAEMKKPPLKLVPRSAVRTRGGASVVFTIDGERVHMVPVAVGAPFAGGLVLERGPDPGTKVVVDPPEQLADGQTIKEKTGS
jgi:RND family efflux transporter MFP subunit